MVAPNLRDEMLAAGCGKELEVLIGTGRGLQDELMHDETHRQRTVGVLLDGLVRMEEKCRCIPGDRSVESQDHVDGLLLERAERSLGVELQIERRVSFECLLREPDLAHVREAPQPRLVAPVGSADQKRPVAVEQTVGLNALAASASGGLSEVAKLDDSAARDALAKQREESCIETLFRARPGGQPLGVEQRLEVGFNSCQRVAANRGAQLGGQIPGAWPHVRRG